MNKFLFVSFLQIILLYPAHANDRSLTWGMSMLKDISGVIGAAEACNNQYVHTDAVKAHRATLKSLIKNGVIPEEDKSFIIDMNAKTALQVKKDFFKDSPVSCSDLPEVWREIKADMGI